MTNPNKDTNLKAVPTCVYVQYYKLDDLDKRIPCDWKIGDLPHGVYPVTPVCRQWKFAGDNKISRYQLPLIPAFARTAYSMQGQTLRKGVIDLTMSHPMDPTTGYVAMSRFKRADDVLIMQPFDLAFYQQGPMLEPTLFLEANKRRLIEGLEIHSIFDNYETKAKRNKAASKQKAKVCANNGPDPKHRKYNNSSKGKNRDDRRNDTRKQQREQERKQSAVDIDAPENKKPALNIDAPKNKEPCKSPRKIQCNTCKNYFPLGPNDRISKCKNCPTCRRK